MSRNRSLALAATAPVFLNLVYVASIRAQSLAQAPKLEVVSVKRCTDSFQNAGKSGRGGGGPVNQDPGMLSIECRPVEQLIRWAYIWYPDGKPWPVDAKTGLPTRPFTRLMDQPIQGEPGWLSSERYTIDARPETPQNVEMMRGPMMRTILEDRFKLRVHRESKPVPVYNLVVAKGGPKLQASKDDSCTRPDLSKGPPAPPGPNDPPFCGMHHSTDRGIDTKGESMADFATLLMMTLNEEVVDKTGIAGTFDVHFELVRPELTEPPPPNSPSANSPATDDQIGDVRAALSKLGLDIEPAKTAAEFVVIDHIERPTEN
jgi:uncharacterized protein (TIGR03435 family)